MEDDDFVPMTAEEAEKWRKDNPSESPWVSVKAQWIATLLVVILAAAVSKGDLQVVKSTAYGALAAVLPATWFARRAALQAEKNIDAGSAFFALMVFEFVKIALTIALLVLAKFILIDVNWLALLAGFVVAIKAAWVALWRMSLTKSVEK